MNVLILELHIIIGKFISLFNKKLGSRYLTDIMIKEVTKNRNKIKE